MARCTTCMCFKSLGTLHVVAILVTHLIILVRPACLYNPEYHDTWLICKIFENIDMDSSIQWWNSTESNYCNWIVDSNYFQCINNVNITRINLEGLEYCIYPPSKINPSNGWPASISHIDIDSYWCSPYGFDGELDFLAMSNLQNLNYFDIEHNHFNQTITNNDWNILLTQLSNLNILDVAKNDFSSNFSEISLSSFSYIDEFKIDGNNFYGILSIDGFLTKFPNLIEFSIYGNHFSNHFDNLDWITSMPLIRDFEIDNNSFTGSIKLSSTSISLPSSLEYIDFENNQFEYIDWNIFANLNHLDYLDISNNPTLNASIDWSIIGRLSHWELDKFYADNVPWNGYADFTQIDEDLIVHLNAEYLCDPAIYICPQNEIMVNRAYGDCIGRSDCEDSCRCSDNSIPVTAAPSNSPTSQPTDQPSNQPSNQPTNQPSNQPTVQPTDEPTTHDPSSSESILSLNIVEFVLVLILFGCILIIIILVCLVIIFVSAKRNKKKEKDEVSVVIELSKQIEKQNIEPIANDKDEDEGKLEMDNIDSTIIYKDLPLSPTNDSKISKTNDKKMNINNFDSEQLYAEPSIIVFSPSGPMQNNNNKRKLDINNFSSSRLYDKPAKIKTFTAGEQNNGENDTLAVTVSVIPVSDNGDI